MPARQTREVRALTRGLRLLEILAVESRGVSLNEIAAVAGLARSSTYRLLQTLILNGYVVQDDSGGQYSPSLKLLMLSNEMVQDTSASLTESDETRLDGL
jgi:DNA-binding IclR family transcriptional regulator